MNFLQILGAILHKKFQNFPDSKIPGNFAISRESGNEKMAGIPGFEKREIPGSNYYYMVSKGNAPILRRIRVRQKYENLFLQYYEHAKQAEP